MGSLVHQLLNEAPIAEVQELASKVLESNYDFFLCSIPSLRKIEIFDYTAYSDVDASALRKGTHTPYKLTAEEQVMLDTMRAAGQEKIALKIIKQNHSKKRNRSRNGQLWTWTCKLPINLERYQIFNELNAETAKKMMKDSCFIYACIQAGVDEATINHMREIVRVKDFPMSKIKVIAKETGIRFQR
ncbi:hypothetical protein TVAG_142550 [Trichomonas vaginalis G3]|uniref:Uncharacterized protein n=1 Tax=Trichomonas vaginalis (strain ATCC PRA-98 / G3) TaxID=412133 RepID=A2GVS9_TRIV3|nr:organellar and viral DNA polymerase type B [Trichomonas vaginalis G3]EAX78739.1 hypothetical protein TVAG_142550 [Trichomonas vaginalis G3]KAI5542280.1 organellar and viral DNA polymerase type B [Trichomonas vaginalis G3]|eukprot:XP_001291669.1 hypothetical protein [Trichomonas vaginalis G3]